MGEPQSEEVEGKSVLEVKLHPLVVLNISDHWTRARVQQGDVKRVIGALLGIQNGRTVEIHTSFELVVGKAADGAESLDVKYLEVKKAHYMAVFPTYDLVGWYTTGSSLCNADSLLHRTFMRYNESLLVLQMETQPHPDVSSLPLWIYETDVQVIKDLPKHTFCKVPYVIESEESERISVDNVAHGTGTNSITTPLKMYKDALGMLHNRVGIVKVYLQGVKEGRHPIDHSILRDISALCNRLPTQSSMKFRESYEEEYCDSMLIAYLGMLTRLCCSLSDLVEKHMTDKRTLMRRPWSKEGKE